MSQPIEVIGGIDTHTDVHQAAVIDTIGRHLATEAFPTTPAGYRDLLEWLQSYGQVLVVGMEGTGSFGAELGRYLRANQIGVIEVDRPDRRARRAAGKSDSIDAYAAATAVLAGRATGIPKSRDGAVEAIRGLRVVRASAVKARMRHDPRTRDYVARRTQEGLKTKDIFRCLKRFVAREVYHHLTSAFSGAPQLSPTA